MNCLTPFGMDEIDDIWVYPDVWWKRSDTADLVDAMIQMARRRRPIEWFAEDEHIRKAIGPFLNKEMVAKKVYFVVTPLVSSRDLRSRAASIRGRVKQRKVHFPAFTSWWAEAKHELLTFDKGTHDDFVAALAKIGQGLDRMVKPSPQNEPEVDNFESELNKPFVPTLGWLKGLEKRQADWERERYGGR